MSGSQGDNEPSQIWRRGLTRSANIYYYNRPLSAFYSESNLPPPPAHDPTPNLAAPTDSSGSHPTSLPPIRPPHPSSNPDPSAPSPPSLVNSVTPIQNFPLQENNRAFERSIVIELQNALRRHGTPHSTGLQFSRVGFSQEQSQLFAIIYIEAQEWTDAQRLLWREELGRLATAISDLGYPGWLLHIAV